MAKVTINEQKPLDLYDLSINEYFRINSTLYVTLCSPLEVANLNQHNVECYNLNDNRTELININKKVYRIDSNSITINIKF